MTKLGKDNQEAGISHQDPTVVDITTTNLSQGETVGIRDQLEEERHKDKCQLIRLSHSSSQCKLA